VAERSVEPMRPLCWQSVLITAATLSACTAPPPALGPASQALVGCYELRARDTTASWRRLPDTLALTSASESYGSDVERHPVRLSDHWTERFGVSWIWQARGDSLWVGERAMHPEFTIVARITPDGFEGVATYRSTDALNEQDTTPVVARRARCLGFGGPAT